MGRDCRRAAGEETAFQRLLDARGETFDWDIPGAPHALPLAYGAGPVFNRFVFEQALEYIHTKNLLYIIDSCAFKAFDRNEDRIVDRKLLRKTPLRSSTASLMPDYVLHDGVDPRGLIDCLTCFSKRNDPARISTRDWRGVENFDRKARPSRYALTQHINDLFPRDQPDQAVIARYLDALETLFATAQPAGTQVVVIKMPVTDAFRKALPYEAAFDDALNVRIARLGIDCRDLCAVLPDASLCFDVDHLKRQGVDAFYTD